MIYFRETSIKLTLINGLLIDSQDSFNSPNLGHI